MQTVKLNIFSFSELSAKSQAKAISDYRRTNCEYFEGSDYTETIKKALDCFDVTLVNYSIDYSCAARSTYSLKFDSNIEELSSTRLRTWLIDNHYSVFYTKEKNKVVDSCCPFTGFCGDEDFLDTFREFIKKPDNRTFPAVIESAIKSVLQAIEKDYDYRNSDEYVIEMFEANDFTFLENGKVWN